MKFTTSSNLSKTVACPNCYGTGTTPLRTPEGWHFDKRCRRCKGEGKLTANSVSEYEAIQLQAIEDRRAYWYER